MWAQQRLAPALGLRAWRGICGGLGGHGGGLEGGLGGGRGSARRGAAAGSGAAGAGPVLLEETSRCGGVLTLTLNRPSARNALSLALLESLHARLTSLRDGQGSAGAPRCLVLRASGPAFCAGHDLRELTSAEQRSPERRLALFQLCSDVMLLLSEIPQPVVAAVHGVATAAGCQLATAADMTLCTPSARFSTPGVAIGLFCSTPAVPLVRSVGRKAAMDMLLTGRFVGALEAQRIGLVSRVVPLPSPSNGGDASADASADPERSAVHAAAHDLALGIAQRSGPALAIGKRTFNVQAELPLAEAYAAASSAMSDNLATYDAAEGITAFLAKRSPSWLHK
jgi:enoyl-CoA hydratase/carnithine racemase